MKKTLLAALVMALPASKVLAQATPSPIESWETIFFDSPSIALPQLTAAVLHHSAPLKLLELDKMASQQDVQIIKKNILSSLAAGGTYSYGNLGGIGIPDPSNPNQFNTANSTRYSAGVSLSVSLAQLLSRHNQIKRELLNLQRNEVTQQDRIDQTRQLVIQSYQNVVLSHRLLLLQQQAFVTTQSTYHLIEKQFRQGQVALPDMSAASTQLTAASIALETARSQYETSFMLLEEMAGTKISTIMTTPSPQ